MNVMSETTASPIGASTTSYYVEISHSRNEGLTPLAIAGPHPQQMTFVRTHAPFEMQSVYWSATREGGPPLIPSWKSFFQDQNVVFLWGQRSSVIPPSVINGHSFHVAGVYHYALAVPRGLDSAMMLGVQPWEIGRLASNENYIPAENFIQGIICPTQMKPVNFQSGIEIPRPRA